MYSGCSGSLNEDYTSNFESMGFLKNCVALSGTEFESFMNADRLSDALVYLNI